MTAVAVGIVAHFVCGQAGPAAIVIGNGLALSSTAVVLQVIIYLSHAPLVFRFTVSWLLFGEMHF